MQLSPFNISAIKYRAGMVASLYFGNATLLIDCDADDFSYGLYD